jgi:hypothetical protein
MDFFARLWATVSKILPFTQSKPQPVVIEDLPPGRMLVSQRAIDGIVGFEISSAAYYQAKLERPSWPGGESGVTIGIGYDLGYSTRAQFRADWQDLLPSAECGRLESVIELKGTAAKAKVAGLRDIRIPLLQAEKVFEVRTLPAYAKRTRAALPGCEFLPADAQGALLSLVFNRGDSMSTADSRREMRAIRSIVRDCGWKTLRNDARQRVLDDVAAQIRAMKRLWDPKKLGGLHARRDAEADLVKDALRVYQLGELVVV